MTEAEVGNTGMDLAVPEQAKAVVETSATAVAHREQSEVVAAYKVALDFPRIEENARQKILASCRKPGFADTARYSKPIGKGQVHGLSVRFAEEMARLWGNLRVKSAVVFDDRERRIYTVSAIDLETNAGATQDIVIEKTIERKNKKQGDEILSSRTNSYGETVYVKVATEDEVMVKANAQISKAKRNLILSLIPSDVREEAEAEVVKTMEDRDRKDPEGETKKLYDAFFKLGVMPDQVQGLFGKPLAQMNPADLAILRAAYTALKEGESTWADIKDDPVFAHGKKKDAKGNGKAKTLAEKAAEKRAAVAKKKKEAAAKEKAERLDKETGELSEAEADEERRIAEEDARLAEQE